MLTSYPCHLTISFQLNLTLVSKPNFSQAVAVRTTIKIPIQYLFSLVFVKIYHSIEYIIIAVSRVGV